MNTLHKAIDQLEEFMTSTEKTVLIKGTQHFKKHLLALHIIGNVTEKCNILFRCNTIHNAGDFLKTKTPARAGKAYLFDNEHSVYIDTNSRFTWGKSPKEVDYSIVYPIDSLCKEYNKEVIIEDIIQRTKKKIFLISCKDVHDYQWLNQYVQRYVIYDQKQAKSI
ncbi:hypothetical protein [Bacillus massiliigorillae]|uniref:hypothetical protein n=1 Tax=Bacillus massiliigorillae TaxID=1243664 RepID=UPI0003A35693|nr:hypothetical protein [Bacillus massiliigorillae]